jgi:hypothetical protein
MSLDIRKHHEKRLKEKSKKILKGFGKTEITEKDIGKTFQTHGAKCSCYACGNPRKHFGEKTLGEIRANISGKDLEE